MKSDYPPTDFPLPANLVAPVDDGQAAHLIGLPMPAVTLASTVNRIVELRRLGSQRTVLYCYPMTGVPGEPLPDGWNEIPGARGCTPEACGFRDHHQELADVGVEVFGLSTQTVEYQSEMAKRLQLPFEILSDADRLFSNALSLPTFVVGDRRFLKRLTLIVRGSSVEYVFYPVFPPDQHAERVIDWLKSHPI